MFGSTVRMAYWERIADIDGLGCRGSEYALMTDAGWYSLARSGAVSAEDLALEKT